MRIDQFHTNLRELANLGQSQYMPPETIDLQINNAIKDLFKQEYKHFEATQEITDTLGFYKKKSAALIIDGEGKVDLPIDFYHLTNVEVVLNDDSVRGLEMISDSHWGNRKRSVSFAPSDEWPIGRQIGARVIEALPLAATEPVVVSGIKSVTVYYLRKPADAIFGYVPNGSGTGWIYQGGSSIQVDWPEIGHSEIQDKALRSIGILLRDNTLIGAETVKTQTNEAK